MEIDQETYFKLKKDLSNRNATIKRQRETIKNLKHNLEVSQSREANKELVADIKRYLGAEGYRNFLLTTRA